MVFHLKGFLAKTSGLLICLIIVVAGFTPKKELVKKSPAKPNVIYILADDMGYGELGCYGQQKILTPNIDKLAGEGIKFMQHYVGAPVCAASRCNLMTGRNAGHAYRRGNVGLPNYKENVNEPGSFPIPESMPTLGTLFKNPGYATAATPTCGLGS